MIGFGVFLVACGLLGWAAAGFTAKAKTAILSGGMSGGLMIGSGWLASRPSLRARNIGRAAGTALPLLFTGVFSWRSIIAWQSVAAGAPKLYVAVLLSTMAVAALATFAILLWTRGAGRSATRNELAAAPPSR